MTLEMGNGSSRKSSSHVAGSLEELRGGIFYGLRLYRLYTCWTNIYCDYFQRVFVFLLFSLIKQQRRRKTIFKKFF